MHLHEINHSQIIYFLNKQLGKELFSSFIIQKETINWIIYFLTQKTIDSLTSNNNSNFILTILGQQQKCKNKKNLKKLI